MSIIYVTGTDADNLASDIKAQCSVLNAGDEIRVWGVSDTTIKALSADSAWRHINASPSGNVFLVFSDLTENTVTYMFDGEDDWLGNSHNSIQYIWSIFPKLQSAKIGYFSRATFDELTTIDFSGSDVILPHSFQDAKMPKLSSMNLTPIKTIAYRAFKSANLGTLTTLDLSSKGISDEAFLLAELSSLTSLDLSTVASVGQNTFQEAKLTNLASLTMPQAIPAHLFSTATLSGLTTLDLSAVTTVDPDTFSDMDLSHVENLILPGHDQGQGNISWDQLLFSDLKTVDVSNSTKLTDFIFTGKNLSHIISLDLNGSDGSLSGSIGMGAFIGADLSGLETLTGVHVNAIKVNAFKNTKITKLGRLDLSHVSDLGISAFESAQLTTLSDFYFPQKIRQRAFSDVNMPALLTLNLSAVSDIAPYAFEGANLSGVKTITWPTACYIGDYAFKEVNFSSITESDARQDAVNTGNRTFGSDVFLNAIFKSSSTSDGNRTSDGNQTSDGNRMSDGNQMSDVNQTSDHDYSDWTDEEISDFIKVSDLVTQVKIKDTAYTNLNDNLFQNLTASTSTSISFPAATTIGNSAFECFKAPAATTFTVSPKATTIGGKAFKNASLPKIKTLNFKNITTLGSDAFSGIDLSAVRIMNFQRLTAISSGAFQCAQLPSLQYLYFPNVTTIPQTAFKGARFDKVKTIKLPKINLATTCQGIFADTYFPSLKSIKLPKGIKVQDALVKFFSSSDGRSTSDWCTGFNGGCP